MVGINWAVGPGRRYQASNNSSGSGIVGMVPYLYTKRCPNDVSGLIIHRATTGVCWNLNTSKWTISMTPCMFNNHFRSCSSFPKASDTLMIKHNTFLTDQTVRQFATQKCQWLYLEKMTRRVRNRPSKERTGLCETLQHCTLALVNKLRKYSLSEWEP